MNWAQAESEIRAYIEVQWAASAYSGVRLFWENEDWIEGTEEFIYVDIQGVFSEKTIFGGVGKRMSVENGIVFLHAFNPKGTGKSRALSLLVSLTQILELKSIGTGGVIDLEGGAPPSPVEDDALVSGFPGGNYYRCSGSVPFIVRSSI